ncbi:hypothetical protein [Pseudarthrobacter defluvii]|uniref:hypothetical protein n=1 Tax=Pseudarthrobacter defluvii TaxID=410837 RepID=UPI00257650FB|nr:hypothetical protein [Pseudarthrobacter defluvii]WJH26703.1 hypothetical protein JCQ34_19730 [Pseudarthrobacter defluvii]
MSHEDNYVERALRVGEGLTGLSLEQLGFEPRLEDLTAERRSLLCPDDIEWMDSITPKVRDRSLFQARLLAGALWEASVVLIDQLFEDLAGLRKLHLIDREDIANTFVLSGLPPRLAHKYDVGFVQRFLVVAADMTGALVRGWDRPSCVAQELALRCLLDQVEVIQDSYDLDLADDWRGMLEERLFEDMDSELLYQNAMDGFENDVELNMQLGFAPMNVQDWFEPFNDASVPPFAR